MVSQFHGLLPVQLALLSGEHEGQESVATPVDMQYLLIRNGLSSTLPIQMCFLTRIYTHFLVYSRGGSGDLFVNLLGMNSVNIS